MANHRPFVPHTDGPEQPGLQARVALELGQTQLHQPLFCEPVRGDTQIKQAGSAYRIAREAHLQELGDIGINVNRADSIGCMLCVMVRSPMHAVR